MRLIQGIRNLLTRQTIEYPNQGLVLMSDSSSGVPVNEQTAMTYAAVFRAVSLVARDIAKLPVITYRRLEEGGKERYPEHPAYRLLKRAPNEYQTPFVFHQTLMAWTLLWGNGYAEVMRDGRGRPLALVPLDSPCVIPVRVTGGDRQGIWYEYTSSTSATSRWIPAADMIHVRGVGDDLAGYSILRIAAESLGLGLAARTYGSVFFRNNGRPSVVLQHPQRLSEEAAKRLRESWQRTYTGVHKQHKVAVLEEGMQLNAFSMPNDDAQFLETRQFEIREVANWFGIPPHKLGDSSKVSYNSLEAENRTYLAEALDQWLVCLENEYWAKLLQPSEQQAESVAIAFERRAFMRPDATTRANFYQSALMGGWMSRDEIRAREDLNPIPGGEGQEFYQPLNVTTTGADDDPAAQETDAQRATLRLEAAEPELVGVHLDMIQDAATALCVRLGGYAKRAAKRPEEFMAWLDTFNDRNADAIGKALGRQVQALQIVTGGQGRIEDARDAVVGGFRAVLLDAAGARPSELPAAVAAGVEIAVRDIPAAVIKSTGVSR